MAKIEEKPEVFLRKATGLVRSWSVGDAFMYAFFSINLVTLGFYTMSQAWYFQGGMIPALALGAVLVIPEIVVYAGLIAAMPRAGGDYVWQSRILGPALGYVLAMTGWCFILWLWTPLYADMLRHIFLVPLAALFGFKDLAVGLASSPAAWLGVCVFTCLFVGLVIALGMKAYARVQRFCFWLGNGGLIVVILLFLFQDKSAFPAAFDSGMKELFGLDGAYETVRAAGKAAGASTPLWGGGIGPVFLLLPYLAFFNLWPNWGATLYGEVKGAEDFKRNFWGMASALIATTVLAIVFLLALDRGIGFDFYMEANAAFWQARWDPASGPAVLPIWPYPALLSFLAYPSGLLRIILILAMGAWFFGWAGTIYLSSTRIIFSASFDRLLPEAMARVEPKSRTPIYALLAMVIPGLIVSALYVWNVFNFASLTLVSTLVIAITFLGTGVAATILPFAKRDLYEASPLARFKLGPIPLITVAGALNCLFLLYLIYQWFIDPLALYGISYRNTTSLIFMIALYGLALAIYLAMRATRKRGGIDVDKIYGEIPVE